MAIREPESAATAATEDSQAEVGEVREVQLQEVGEPAGPAARGASRSLLRSNMGQPLYFSDQVYWEAFDNVATTIFSRTPPLNSLVTVFVKGSAVRPSTGDVKTWSIMFTIKRSGGSPILSAVTNIFTPVADVGASSWTLVPALNGNSAELRVTGQTGAIIFWNFQITALTSVQ